MIIATPKFTIDVDVEKTKTYYSTAKFISEDCSCIGCRNYEKAIDFISDEIVSFFSRLGVDTKKAREVYVYGPNANGTMLYGGWYHVCGKVISGEIMPGQWNEEKLHIIANSFGITCSNGGDLVDDAFPQPIMQIDIHADVPWVLDEKHDLHKM